MKHFKLSIVFRTFKMGLFITVIILILSKVQAICMDKDSPTKYADFFQNPRQCDVLYIGSSHVRYDFFPMEMWNQYGITSYNFGNNGCFLPVSYWVMENALDYVNPRVVIIDTYFLDEKYKCESTEQKDGSVTANEGRLHLAFDCFPFSKKKMLAVNDLIQDSEQAKRDSFFNKLSGYHNRWDTGLLKNDFYPVNPGEKGASYEYLTVANPIGYEAISGDDILKDNPIGAEYLEEMIADCQKRGIRVLLTYLPFEAEVHYQEEANTTAIIAQKYGVDYINFLKTDSGINYETDLSDTKSYNGHLNPSGARKITSYIGKYLSTHYRLSDHRNDVGYSNWNNDYDKYSDMKLETIEKHSDIYTDLMLLADSDINCCIYIKRGDPLLNDKKLVGLLHNLAGQTKINIKDSNDLFLLVINEPRGKQHVLYDNNIQSDVKESTDLGAVYYKNDIAEQPYLSFNESTNYLKDLNLKDSKKNGILLYWKKEAGEENIHVMRF